MTAKLYNYCTLFDSNYLLKGVAMYESLKSQSSNFHLYLIALDDICYQSLKDLALPNITVIALPEFENERLLKIKPSRTKGEYCWTCTPSIIKYCIEKYDLASCTYVDADLYFFADPAILIEELKENDVLITEHRYTPRYDQSRTSGIYCVQFMTFKNTLQGMEILNWWVDKCIEWCYARFESGKFGDQKYLDDWTIRFKGVKVLENIGGGVAPWNIQQYDFHSLPNNSKILGIVKKDKPPKKFELIFYHFHYLYFVEKNCVDLGSYLYDKKSINLIYKPYLNHLLRINKALNEKLGKNFLRFEKRKLTWKDMKFQIKRWLQKTYNIYKINKIIS